MVTRPDEIEYRIGGSPTRFRSAEESEMAFVLATPFFVRGHRAIADRTGRAIFADTGAPVNGPARDCRACGASADWGEPDPCFGGLLPGVSFACCGHGRGDGYILFTNGTRVEVTGPALLLDP